MSSNESQSFDTIQQIQYDNHMTDDFTLDPARTYKPKQPVLAVKTAVEREVATIDINDAEALRRLAKGKLVAIIQNSPVTASLVPAIRELMDRVDGKPAQSVNLDATVRSITVNAHISFAEMPVRVDNVIEGAVHNSQLIDNE